MANLEQRITEELTDDSVISISWSALSLLLDNAPVGYQNRIIAGIRVGNKSAIGAAIYDLIRSHLRAIAAVQARDIVNSGSIPVDLAEKIAKEG